MVRLIVLILGVLLLFLGVYMASKKISRKPITSVYCFCKNNCITVLVVGSERFVIQGNKTQTENNSYVRAPYGQLLTLYYSDELPYKIFVRDEGNMKDYKKGYEMINNENDKWEFLAYSESYDTILYKPNATKKFEDVKPDVKILSLNLQENYAMDKNGKMYR